VTPNITVPLNGEQERALFASRSTENLKPGRGARPDQDEGPQMLRAVDALKGVMIYAQQAAPKVDPARK
jgi:hypothetical protein